VRRTIGNIRQALEGIGSSLMPKDNEDKLQRAHEYAATGWNEYLGSKNARAALPYAQKALELRKKIAPNSPPLAESLNQMAFLTGQICDEKGQVSETNQKLAEEMFLSAIILAPDDMKAIYTANLAHLYLDMSRFGEAEEALDKVRSLRIDTTTKNAKAIADLSVHIEVEDDLLAGYARTFWGLSRYVEAAKIEVIRSYPDTKMQQLQTELTADFVGDWMMAAVPKSTQFALSIRRSAEGELKAQFRASEPGSGKIEDVADVAVDDSDGIGRLIWTSSPDKDDYTEAIIIRVERFLVWKISSADRSAMICPNTAVLVAKN
jgi:tetratricopeptide (TPR) repeat protein